MSALTHTRSDVRTSMAKSLGVMLAMSTWYSRAGIFEKSISMTCGPKGTLEFELLEGWAPPTEVGRLLLSAKRHSPLYLWLPACSPPTVLVRTTGELWSTQRHTGKLLLPRRAARRARPECGAPSLTIQYGLQDGGIATP